MIKKIVSGLEFTLTERAEDPDLLILNTCNVRGKEAEKQGISQQMSISRIAVVWFRKDSHTDDKPTLFEATKI
ncbi:tRNA-2-methylthio-N(6)-dimethylallyladenosine synthase [Schistosoma japonicum]|uniref:tRNA-2-methylthio-N(6)-dimethylallyladenosine synthase n=1 Tax=Schistosoma japonicum TaxID=6182 RepID=A0A4Z2DR67_SCHJA|nr:tRNA-2-methylthio-N(6)-dimethylallyladenosine synthase [Schistosoma japonicum]